MIQRFKVFVICKKQIWISNAKFTFPAVESTEPLLEALWRSELCEWKLLEPLVVRASPFSTSGILPFPASFPAMRYIAPLKFLVDFISKFVETNSFYLRYYLWNFCCRSSKPLLSFVRWVDSSTEVSWGRILAIVFEASADRHCNFQPHSRLPWAFYVVWSMCRYNRILARSAFSVLCFERRVTWNKIYEFRWNTINRLVETCFRHYIIQLPMGTL